MRVDEGAVGIGGVEFGGYAPVALLFELGQTPLGERYIFTCRVGGEVTLIGLERVRSLSGPPLAPVGASRDRQQREEREAEARRAWAGVGVGVGLRHRQ